LLAELSKRSLTQNTLIIVTADHGESMEYFAHGLDLSYGAIHVPLLIKLPGKVGEGIRQKEPVSLTQIPSTIASLVGLPKEPAFPDAPLPLQPRQELPDSSYALSELTKFGGKLTDQAIVDAGFQYTLNSERHKEELLFAPPVAGASDLSSSPEHAADLERMRQRLKESQRKYADKRLKRVD